MTKLIYHPINQNIDSKNRFENALDQIIKDITRNNSSELLIACPYISLDILQTVTSKVHSWKLVTDFEAWFSSDRRNAMQCAQFACEKNEHIRDFRNLHAKIYLSSNFAMLGSANLTHKGFENRQEMSILIDDKDLLNELMDWFNNIWEVGKCHDNDKITSYAQKVSANDVVELVDKYNKKCAELTLGPAGKIVRSSSLFSSNAETDKKKLKKKIKEHSMTNDKQKKKLWELMPERERYGQKWNRCGDRRIQKKGTVINIEDVGGKEGNLFFVDDGEAIIRFPSTKSFSIGTLVTFLIDIYEKWIDPEYEKELHFGRAVRDLREV